MLRGPRRNPCGRECFPVALREHRLKPEGGHVFAEDYPRFMEVSELPAQTRADERALRGAVRQQPGHLRRGAGARSGQPRRAILVRSAEDRGGARDRGGGQGEPHRQGSGDICLLWPGPGDLPLRLRRCLRGTGPGEVRRRRGAVPRVPVPHLPAHGTDVPPSQPGPEAPDRRHDGRAWDAADPQDVSRTRRRGHPQCRPGCLFGGSGVGAAAHGARAAAAAGRLRLRDRIHVRLEEQAGRPTAHAWSQGLREGQARDPAMPLPRSGYRSRIGAGRSAPGRRGPTTSARGREQTPTPPPTQPAGGWRERVNKTLAKATGYELRRASTKR